MKSMWWMIVACAVFLSWVACESRPPDEQTSDAPTSEKKQTDASEPPAEKPPETPPEPRTPRDVGPLKTEFGGDRPAKIKVPASYDPAQAYPLLVVLHGYGATGQLQSFYLGVNPMVDKEDILLIAPDGTRDSSGKLFWNATDACCDFEKKGVDDVAYLKGLIQEIKAVYHVGPVYLIGHSNGGYMSYRMACDASSLISGVVVLAGAMYAKKEDCQPKKPVSVLHIHGTLDDSVKYEGGDASRPYASAVDSVTYWGGYNGCAGKLEAVSGAMDLDDKIDGKETEVRLFSGCPKGVDVRLWTMQKGLHLPAITPDFAPAVWAWMKAQKKP